MVTLRNAQDIFARRFKKADLAVFQRCSEVANVAALNANHTEHWPPLPIGTDVIALSLVMGNRLRQIWAGRVIDQHPSTTGSKGQQLFRIHVDQFELVGTHDLGSTSDAAFYNNNGGGGSRVIVARSRQSAQILGSPSKPVRQSPGEMIQRLVWLRKNHRHFRDPVWLNWEGKCAVTGQSCNGLLIASHIKPWAESNPVEKTDHNNGLLLSAPLDTLFDRGFIGFANDGKMLVSNELSSPTKKIFGLVGPLALKSSKITGKMKRYLAWHRARYNLS